MLFHHKLALCVSGAALAAAQDQFAYTDAATGAQLQAQKVTQNIEGGFQFGIAFPQTLGADDYIGNIIGARVSGAGWSGINHGAGMLNNLMIIAWADGNDIKTSFRIAQFYRNPTIYPDSASLKLTPLSKVVNATHFNLVYRCQGCFNWDFNGKHYNQSLTGDTVQFSFAQSSRPVKTPSYPSSPISMHNNGYGVLGFNPKPAAQADFSTWAAKSAAAPKGAKRDLVARSPQAAANTTVAALPTLLPTESPSLGTAQPKIPIPVSSASTPIAALETLSPMAPPPKAVPVPLPSPMAPKMPIPRLPIPRLPKNPIAPLWPKGYPALLPKGTGVRPRPKLPKGTGRPLPRPKLPKSAGAPKVPGPLSAPTPLMAPLPTPSTV